MAAQSQHRGVSSRRSSFSTFFFLLKPDVLVLRWALLWASLRRLDDQVSQRGLAGVSAVELL